MILLHACLSAGCARPVHTDDDYCDECRKRLERKQIEQRASAAIQSRKSRGRHQANSDYRLRARAGEE